MNRRNRRIVTGDLTHESYHGGTAYWGHYSRFNNGRHVYLVPFGVMWCNSNRVNDPRKEMVRN